MPVFDQSVPLWSPRTVTGADPVRHIVRQQVEPGQMATAACGHRWKVERVHNRGIAGVTCDLCLAALAH